MQILLFIVGFLLLQGLVLIHEWGHYWLARRNGVFVEEFGLGFPPVLWSKKLKSGMRLSFNLLPLGGFVKLKGEHDADKGPGSFGAASLPAKVKILLAGVTMNFVAGIVILTILALTGLPKMIDKQWAGQDQFTVASNAKLMHRDVRLIDIAPDSPAERAGLVSQDVIKSISNSSKTININTAADLKTATTTFAGQEVQLDIMHKNQPQVKKAHLLTAAEVEASRKTDNPKGYLGVISMEFQVYRYTWAAPIVALGFTKQLIVLTFQGLGHAVSGLGSTIAGLVTNNHQARQNGQTKASSDVGGPVAIVKFLWSGGSFGLAFVLMIIAVISLTLALMNVLPIPALDGGRLFIMLVFRSFRLRLTRTTEEIIHGTGMAVLLALIILITVVDVKRFF